ncbi:hypothetical protein Cni_G25975 [Canna indica]|uniref:Uncharacterized protein n=1 Tax=Canna indica TaxID=4628 RepID=A0AAQ3L2U7_9LILI|nr:hypothetical protein Cni_G25975 [Canna indica]
MGFRRLKILFLVLSICLPSLGESIASAAQKELPKISSRKLLGSKASMYQKDSRTSSPLPESSPPTKKSTNWSSADTVPKAKASTKPVHHGVHGHPFHKSETRKQVDAATEVFNMLHKDYQTRARRRPPINN